MYNVHCHCSLSLFIVIVIVIVHCTLFIDKKATVAVAQKSEVVI